MLLVAIPDWSAGRSAERDRFAEAQLYRMGAPVLYPLGSVYRTVNISGLNKDDEFKVSAVLIAQLLGNIAVDATNGKLTSLESLKESKNIQKIVLAHTNVQNIEPLSDLTNLREVDLSNTGVTDLTPLSKLLLLDSLSVANTSVSDIEALGSLYYLTQANLSGTAVQDIAPLSDHDRLQYLDLSNTKVKNLEPLQDSNLEYLNVTGTSIKSLDPVRGLKHSKVEGFVKALPEPQKR